MTPNISQLTRRSFTAGCGLGAASLAFGSLVFEPFLGVRNLLDSRQGAPNVFGPGSTEFSNGAARDSDFVFGPIQPRTIFAGVKGTL